MTPEEGADVADLPHDTEATGAAAEQKISEAQPEGICSMPPPPSFTLEQLSCAAAILWPLVGKPGTHSGSIVEWGAQDHSLLL